MAVDYTKVFTVIGSYGDKINDYQAYIATYTSGQTAIETVLAAQTLVRLEDGLTDLFDDFKQDIADGSNDLVDRITTVLTDETLIGANFAFGTSPTLQLVFPALIHDMVGNDKNVAANSSTIGSRTYTTTNSTVGKLMVGVKLDGVSSPMQGAQAIPDYADVNTQLTPTSETLTFTCVSDSENGGTRGSEIFNITGTGADSDGYDVTGENAGQLGSITVADATLGLFITNNSFDTWANDLPTGWTVVAGTENVDFEEGTTILYGTGSSLKIFAAGGDPPEFTQIIPSTSLTRKKAYFLSGWGAKDADLDANQEVLVTLSDDTGTLAQLSMELTGTAWEHFSNAFVVPAEIVGDLVLSVSAENLEPLSDDFYVDQIGIIEAQYHEGVAWAIVSGPDKFLIGDTISVPISNNDAGKFQTLFRKAYKIQLPTDATPTISDSLYA